MKIALRNLLAEWCLDAVADPAGERRIEALAAFAQAADANGAAGALGEEPCRTLAESPLFERMAPGGLRLRADVVRDVEAMRERSERFLVALAASRAACGARGPTPTLGWTLCAAGALFNARLFFEVHELLEERWRPAEGPLREFLQGLIQVAVGFHHLENGNLRGAISLLGEGVEKLRPFHPEAYGVELAEFSAALGRVRLRLGNGNADGIEPPRLGVRQSAPERTR